MSVVAITGALSFTGRYLARHLLDNTRVSTVINLSRRRTPISSHNLDDQHLARIRHGQLCFDDKQRLMKSLDGVDVLYCTYWIRFATANDNHAKAAERCRILFECARDAGVRKVVFTAHTGMSIDSPFDYIRGKAQACQYLREVATSQMNYAIIKPHALFGDIPDESILFNNAAYVLRRTPLFLLPRDGQAQIQPIHAREMAVLMADAGTNSVRSTGEEWDAVGSQAPPAMQLFRSLRDHCGARWCHVAASHLPPRAVGYMTKPLDWYTGDVLLDGDDLDLMYNGLTMPDNPADGRIATRTGILDWIAEMGPRLGQNYVNSTARYYTSG